MTQKNFQIWSYSIKLLSGQFASKNEILEPIGAMTPIEREHIGRAVTAYKSGQTVEFCEHINRNHWKYFNEQTKGIQGKVKIWAPFPEDWEVDNNKQVIVHNTDLREEVVELLGKREQFRFQTKRQVMDLDKHFLMTYGSTSEYEREQVMQSLERLKVLDQSIYSRPRVSPEMQEQVNIDYIFPIRNDYARYRNIEGIEQETSKKYLYDQSSVLPVLYRASKRVHCWAVLDVFPFVEDITTIPSEKFLWPIFFGIPFIYIGSKRQMDMLRGWGFEPNDPHRSDVRSTVEQMMWLKSIFSDPVLAQQWQDSQGELINKNLKALESLPEKLLPFRNNPA